MCGEYGFTVNGDVRVDMNRVKARKDAISGRSNKGIEEWRQGLKNCTVMKGIPEMVQLPFTDCPRQLPRAPIDQQLRDFGVLDDSRLTHPPHIKELLPDKNPVCVDDLSTSNRQD